MEYVTKTARVVPEREARAFWACGGQYAGGSLMEYVTKAARVLPLWGARAFLGLRPGQFAHHAACNSRGMRPRQYAHGSLMEYVTKAARAVPW